MCLFFGVVMVDALQSSKRSYLINNLENIKGSSSGYSEGFKVKGCYSTSIASMDYTEENLWNTKSCLPSTIM
jgi:hypothetical protein